MKFHITILVAALVGAASAEVNNKHPVLTRGSFDNSIIEYILEPSASAAAAADPDLSANCFNYYLPIINDVASTFSVQYQACITLANEQTTNLTDQAAQERVTYEQQASDIYAAYEKCNNLTVALDFLNCYATVSNQGVSQVYNISNQAQTAATTLSQGLKQIVENQDSCTNATERSYIEGTADTYKKLGECMQNGLPTGSTLPPTTTVTEAPVETTTQEDDNDNNNKDNNAALVMGPPIAPVQSAPVLLALRRMGKFYKRRN